jgi:hypothetical protein
MGWDVVEVEIAGGFEIKVRFRDGVEGLVKFLPTFFAACFLI